MLVLVLWRENITSFPPLTQFPRSLSRGGGMICAVITLLSVMITDRGSGSGKSWGGEGVFGGQNRAKIVPPSEIGAWVGKLHATTGSLM